MHLIVGLGNPGKEYEKTRHGVGFLCIEHFVTVLEAPQLAIHKKSNSLVSSTTHNSTKYILAEPLTFMNNSGEAVSALLQFYKLTPADLLVIHDDLDIEFGSWKIQQGRGPKVHYGLISIENSLKTSDFKRLRIGVDGREPGTQMSGGDYVLAQFTKDELAELQTRIFRSLESELF